MHQSIKQATGQCKKVGNVQEKNKKFIHHERKELQYVQKQQQQQSWKFCCHCYGKLNST